MVGDIIQSTSGTLDGYQKFFKFKFRADYRASDGLAAQHFALLIRYREHRRLLISWRQILKKAAHASKGSKEDINSKKAGAPTLSAAPTTALPRLRFLGFLRRPQSSSRRQNEEGEVLKNASVIFRYKCTSQTWFRNVKTTAP